MQGSKHDFQEIAFKLPSSSFSYRSGTLYLIAVIH